MSTKPIKQPLLLVLEKEKEEQQKMGNKIRRMRIFIESEKTQEQSLQGYKNEYLQKMREQKLCAIAEINRYRSFCSQLDQAIEQQQEKIRLAEKNLSQLQEALVKQQHKMTVLSELIEKQEKIAQHHEDKLAQKVSDELASRKLSSSSL